MFSTNILKAAVLSGAQEPESRTLLPGFTTPEQTFQKTTASDDTELLVRSGNIQNPNDGDAYNYDDDSAVGVFARRIKRPKPFRSSLHPFATPRVPTLTEQGQRLPRHLRSGYRRGQQDIIVGGESYQDLDYTLTTSQRRVSTPSYGRVHTTLPATNLIPTGGGGYLVTNSFMSGAQRKRLEQQENIDRVLTDLEDCIASNPTDVKLRAKKLHLEELQRRLLRPDGTALKGAEANLIKDVDKMLARRRMNMVAAEFENQARAMVENMTMSSSSSVGRKGRKRGYDEGTGSMSPLSSSWTESAAPSERSSFSHPSTGGKTVPQSYYQRRKRERITHELEKEEADDGDVDEDVVWDDEQQRKTYGGKTVAQDRLGALSDYDTAKILTEAMEGEAGDKEDDNEAEDSGDDVDETGDDNTDDGNGDANESSIIT